MKFLVVKADVIDLIFPYFKYCCFVVDEVYLRYDFVDRKIGRFYTIRNDTARTALTPVDRKQRAILDIEKALSNKDLQSLENCYKRLFNVS